MRRNEYGNDQNTPSAGCGVLLLGAVSAHAGNSLNGISLNGVAVNGILVNGQSFNGLSYNGFRNQGLLIKETKRNGGPSSAVQSESLPFNGLSQRGLGKTNPQANAVHMSFVSSYLNIYCALARAASVPIFCGLI